MIERWGVVADDLTGAADAAAGFADARLRVRIVLEPGAEGEGVDVPVVSTDCRGRGDDDAAALTRDAVARLVALGATRLFVKVDSAARGPLAGVVSGALEGWAWSRPGARALVCPASPRWGRTVRDARVLVDGSPLAVSATASDPVSPRSEGDLTRLLPAARRGVVPAIAAGSVTVVDAETESDLDHVADSAVAAGRALIVVGAGALARAVGRRAGGAAEPFVRPGVRRVVVGVSSLHPRSRSQAVMLSRARPPGTVLVLPEAVAGARPAEVAREYGARVAAAAAASPEPYALLLSGGDGSASALAALGARALDVHGSTAPGGVEATIVGGAADGVRVVTKSGAFGGSPALLDLVRALRAPVDAEPAKKRRTR